MPEIFVRADTLDAENARFAQTPLQAPVFLNSVPKSGSHLLRNILRMFVPVAQQYAADFIQWPNLQQHRHAFDPAQPRLSWGHLFFADASAIETAHARRIVLYRDPYDWVIARARFLLSDQFFGNVHIGAFQRTREQRSVLAGAGLTICGSARNSAGYPIGRTDLFQTLRRNEAGQRNFADNHV